MKIKQFQLTIFIFVISACSIVLPVPAAPIDIEEAYLNNQIRLITVDEIWPLRTNGSLAILLESSTTNEIIFPNNFNLRIFYKENNKWVEIQVRPTTYFYDEIVMNSSEDSISFPHQIVDFWPQYPDADRTYFMRVYVFGNMSTPDGIKVVGAFVDFVVTP